jgi:hypothetical protein
MMRALLPLALAISVCAEARDSLCEVASPQENSDRYELLEASALVGPEREILKQGWTFEYRAKGSEACLWLEDGPLQGRYDLYTNGPSSNGEWIGKGERISFTLIGRGDHITMTAVHAQEGERLTVWVSTALRQ